MSEIDPRLVAALSAQLADWRAELHAGAVRVGWELGMGERLESGDRIITGGIVQVPVAPDEHVVAELGPLGRVALSVS